MVRYVLHIKRFLFNILFCASSSTWSSAMKRCWSTLSRSFRDTASPPPPAARAPTLQPQRYFDTSTIYKHFSSSPDSRMVEFAFRFCCQPLDPAEVTSFNYGVWKLIWKLKKIILVSPPRENLFIFFVSKMFFFLMRFHKWKKCLKNSQEFCFAQIFSCGLTLVGEEH